MIRMTVGLSEGGTGDSRAALGWEQTRKRPRCVVSLCLGMGTETQEGGSMRVCSGLVRVVWFREMLGPELNRDASVRVGKS